jgi:hypothetical protein
MSAATAVLPYDGATDVASSSSIPYLAAGAAILIVASGTFGEEW